MKPTIHFYNNIASHYTAPLLLRLLGSSKFHLSFSCGKNDNWDIKTIDFNRKEFDYFKNQLSDVKNVWIMGKYLVWQRGVVSRCLFGKKVDLIILLGEFTILSNWLGAIICRLRGMSIAFRGHGLYGNEGFLKHLVRTTFYKMATLHLVYERHSKKLMIKNGFDRDSIHVVFNSLDYEHHKKLRGKFSQLSRKEVFPFFKDNTLQTLIFIGRLTKVKRLHMLLEVVHKLNLSGKKINLLIIGDGTEKKTLEDQAQNTLEEGYYHFYGSCYDEDEIGKLLSKADLCVSPGNVGLTSIHSLSLGTPVCTHGNFYNQMPEVEAIENGKTGIFFEENNIEDLFAKINEWLEQHPEKSQELMEKCYEVIDKYYNPTFQEKVFYAMASKQKPLV